MATNKITITDPENYINCVNTENVHRNERNSICPGNYHVHRQCLEVMYTKMIYRENYKPKPTQWPTYIHVKKN